MVSLPIVAPGQEAAVQVLRPIRSLAHFASHWRKRGNLGYDDATFVCSFRATPSVRTQRITTKTKMDNEEAISSSMDVFSYTVSF